MTKTLFDLFKALLNATLILLALCLFLGWKLFTSASAVTDRLGEISRDLTPLHVQAQTLTQEFSDLTQALQRTEGPDSTEMRLRLARVEEQLSALKLEIATLKQLPTQVVSAAVETAVAEISREVARWVPHVANCPAEETASLN
ncbi:hypothetical protein [Pseudophaeobacter sp.]|uniref:hypothetical protein n=1 Tax=Pseudophaeobacter sp. TaxID=1971739 RepID=UPI003296F96E